MCCVAFVLDHVEDAYEKPARAGALRIEREADEAACPNQCVVIDGAGDALHFDWQGGLSDLDVERHVHAAGSALHLDGDAPASVEREIRPRAGVIVRGGFLQRERCRSNCRIVDGQEAQRDTGVTRRSPSVVVGEPDGELIGTG